AAGGTASGPNAAPTNSTAPPAPPRIELTVQQLRLANDDARITASGSWHTGQGAQRWPGVLALQGTLRDGRATAVARYLPLALDAGTRHWVQRAVQAGSVPQLDFLVRGDLARFPFPEPQDGAFRLQAQLQGVTLNAVPDPADGHWPAYTDLAGELVIERQALQLRQLHGRVDGLNLALDGVKGDIRHLGHAALLEISGTARGPASELLRHVQLSPVGGWLDHALARTTASGAAELDL
ncbi:MAG: hypothetical protein CFE45_37445, partial [Burkholderiales bacterium PBB5]